VSGAGRAGGLEVAAGCLASALAAQQGGAMRVELCGGLAGGGLTPSFGSIAIAREQLRLPLYVLIRPRGGDFLYDDAAGAAMVRDIEQCVRLGCDGVAIGALDADGNVDMPRCRTLVQAAGALGVTFHRAFDLSRDPRQALEDIIALGCERVLTSGARERAADGADLIAALVRQAGDRLVVMPGGGIDEGNLPALRERTGAREFHASARSVRPSAMRHRHPHIGSLGGDHAQSDATRIRRMVALLRN
jgi:copper homeostasis protein